MAKYTIELNALLRTGYDIGLKDYPIPSFADEAWRTQLNNKIINHYRYRELAIQHLTDGNSTLTTR